MQTIQKTWSGGPLGKLFIGCTGLIILGCLCAIPTAIFGGLVADSGAIPTPASRLAEFSIETTTPVATNTPPPTATPEPTATLEPPVTPEPTVMPEPTATPIPTDTPIPPQPLPASQHLTRDDLLSLVQTWAGRLDVHVKRIQTRAMRNKWDSISTVGTLTLADDLLHLPRRLVDYVICHELLHLKVPTHNRLYRLLLTRHIPDWRRREQELARWTIAESSPYQTTNHKPPR